MFAFCSSFQLHGIQSFLLCLAHRKTISGCLRKSSYRSRSTRPEGRRQSSLKVGLCVLLRDPSSSAAVGRLLMADEAGDRNRLWKACLESQSLDWLPGKRSRGHPLRVDLCCSSHVTFFSVFWVKIGLLYKKWLIFICMSAFSWAYICALNVCLVPLEARRRCQIVWNLWTALWVLKPKSKSSVSALNHWAICSPRLFKTVYRGNVEDEERQEMGSRS